MRKFEYRPAREGEGVKQRRSWCIRYWRKHSNYWSFIETVYPDISTVLIFEKKKIDKTTIIFERSEKLSQCLVWLLASPSDAKAMLCSFSTILWSSDIYHCASACATYYWVNVLRGRERNPRINATKSFYSSAGVSFFLFGISKCFVGIVCILQFITRIETLFDLRDKYICIVYFVPNRLRLGFPRHSCRRRGVVPDMHSIFGIFFFKMYLTLYISNTEKGLSSGKVS